MSTLTLTHGDDVLVYLSYDLAGTFRTEPTGDETAEVGVLRRDHAAHAAQPLRAHALAPAAVDQAQREPPTPPPPQRSPPPLAPPPQRSDQRHAYRRLVHGRQGLLAATAAGPSPPSCRRRRPRRPFRTCRRLAYGGPVGKVLVVVGSFVSVTNVVFMHAHACGVNVLTAPARDIESAATQLCRRCTVTGTGTNWISAPSSRSRLCLARAVLQRHAGGPRLEPRVQVEAEQPAEGRPPAPPHRGSSPTPATAPPAAVASPAAVATPRRRAARHASLGAVAALARFGLGRLLGRHLAGGRENGRRGGRERLRGSCSSSCICCTRPGSSPRASAEAAPPPAAGGGRSSSVSSRHAQRRRAAGHRRWRRCGRRRAPGRRLGRRRAAMICSISADRSSDTTEAVDPLACRRRRVCASAAPSFASASRATRALRPRGRASPAGRRRRRLVGPTDSVVGSASGSSASCSSSPPPRPPQPRPPRHRRRRPARVGRRRASRRPARARRRGAACAPPAPAAALGGRRHSVVAPQPCVGC